jgi:hypothetical protein
LGANSPQLRAARRCAAWSSAAVVGRHSVQGASGAFGTSLVASGWGAFVRRVAWMMAFKIAKSPPPVFGNLSHIRDTPNLANGTQSQASPSGWRLTANGRWLFNCQRSCGPRIGRRHYSGCEAGLRRQIWPEARSEERETRKNCPNGAGMRAIQPIALTLAMLG